MIVRQADYDDVGDIVRLWGAASIESDVPFASPKRPDADWYIGQRIKRGFVFVVDNGKNGQSELVGMAVFDVVMPNWNQDPENAYVINNEFYIAPDFRSGGVGDKLIAEGKKIAQEMQRPFFFSITFGGQIYELSKWLQMKEFKPAGGNFYWVPPVV